MSIQKALRTGAQWSGGTCKRPTGHSLDPHRHTEHRLHGEWGLARPSVLAGARKQSTVLLKPHMSGGRVVASTSYMQKRRPRPGTLPEATWPALVSGLS